MNLPVKRVENHTVIIPESKSMKTVAARQYTTPEKITKIAQRNRRRGHRQKPETNSKHLQISSVTVNWTLAVKGLAPIRACSCRTNTKKGLTPENGRTPKKG